MNITKAVQLNVYRTVIVLDRPIYADGQFQPAGAILEVDAGLASEMLHGGRARAATAAEAAGNVVVTKSWSTPV